MAFDEILAQVLTLLQQEKRVSYRGIKRRFGVDDEYLEDLKEELCFSHPEIADEAGRGLVWKDRLEPSVPSRESKAAPSSDPRRQTPDTRPISYTPAHLAERIRAVTVNTGERKTVTALFADLKGSTALIEDLDPEEAQRVIDPALQLMMDAVHQYEGYVAKTLGDGILALFGAPLAHEDHPHRALYAALRMQAEMRRYSDRLRGQGYPPLLMRVGLNTGEVVVRSIRKDDLHTDYDPIGHSTHVASRMEQLASPGAVVVSAHTQKLTDGYFAFKDLGPTKIKGIEEPLNIYELQEVGQLRTRLQVSASRYGLARFVGRQTEMEQLNKALAQAKAGHGQIVGAMGEPGLGKSRLFHEFKLLSLTGCLVLEAYSVSHGKATAYLPVIELLKSYFEIKSEDDGRKRREKVTGKVLNLDRSLEDTLPYLFALLGIEEQPSPLAQMDPQIRRQRTFEALKKLFLRESLNQPLVLIFEDLHWIDGETQGFLDVLSESVASAKILLLTNYRPEYKHEWGQKTYYTQLRLAPLGKEEAEEFLDILLGEYPRPVGERDRVRGTDNNLHSLKQLILDKTQGTPFFMEEVIQTLAEEGTLSGERGAYRLARATTTLQLPPTVQGILAARIDRLAPDEKALLQQLSVIGRQFPLSLIRQVILQSEADLYRLLASLQRKEFLYEQPAFPESEYIFKHALTQDVAYGTVLQEQKKLLHEQTAQAIEQMYKDKLEERYGELAHHYQRSGNTEKAVEYLQKAGQQSARRSAPAEAMTYLTTALDLLKTVPTSPVNLQTELTLQITLGPVLIATKGFAAVEVEHAYTRAQELCRQVGDTPQIVPVLVALALFHFARANHKGAHELGKQLLSLADKTQDSALLLEAHRVLAFTALWRGDMVAARAYAEKGRLLYDPHLHRSHAFLYGSDPGVVCGYYLMFSLWFLGYPEQASKGVLEVLSRARELAHPFSLASAQSAVTIVRQLLRDERAVQEWAEANIALCTEHGISFWLAGCLFWRGWALGAQGQREEGIAQMQQGLAAWRASGAEVGLPQYLALLAELYGKTGRAAEGLALVDEALMIADRTEEKLHEAELWRIKGELLLVQAETLRACESSGD